MRTFIFTIAVIGLIAMTLSGGIANGSSHNSGTGILDGMVFVGHVGPKGRAANGEDEVVFQNGLLLSTSCSAYGFESAPYNASRSGDSITFSAVTHSPKHGQIEWRGAVVGDTIEASYRWTKERWYWFDANEEHWLKARLKQD